MTNRKLLHPFPRCLYFFFILLLIISMYYCVRVLEVHPNICLHKVGFLKTKISVVLALKRWCERRSTSLKYKGMETLLGEGIKLKDIPVICETLYRVTYRKRPSKKCRISSEWGKGETDVHSQSTGVWT